VQQLRANCRQPRTWPDCGLVLGDLALVRAVAARDVEGNLWCVAAFGSAAWDRLCSVDHGHATCIHRALRSGGRVAPSTPGDILLHFRAKRKDLCFELAAHYYARNVMPFREVDAPDPLSREPSSRPTNRAQM